MYLAPWQVFLGGCVIGTLISLIVLTVVVLQALNRFGIVQAVSTVSKSSEDNDLIAKLCFILMAKGYLDEVDNDFMLDNATFDEWRKHVDVTISDDDQDD